MKFRYLICLLALLLVVSVTAQEPTEVNTVQTVSLSVDPDDDEPTAVLADRVQDSTCGVYVVAPEALMLRALKSVEEAGASDEQVSPEEGEEEQDGDRTKQVRGKQVGYRVQVFADNNVRTAKTEARQRERAISQSFPDYGTYVSYASPFWRLRVGDFRSQYEAEKAAAEIKKHFPRYAREVRVVRDRVNIR